MKNKDRVSSVIWQTVRRKKVLSLGIVCAVAGAIAFSLFPPLILGKIIDSLTAGQSVSIGMVKPAASPTSGSSGNSSAVFSTARSRSSTVSTSRMAQGGIFTLRGGSSSSTKAVS